MRRSLTQQTGWSPTVVRAACAVPICTAFAAIVQHGFTARAVALGCVAALPWVLLALGILLPWWLSAVVEIGCTAGFMADPATYDVAPLLLVIFVALVAATNPGVVALLTAGASGAMMVGLELAGRFEGTAIWILALALGWLGGFVVRLQEQAQAAREVQAADAERARIALELHDVVAHSLAVTMLNLSAARLALRRDPDEAEAALRQAEESGRQSMTDIRDLVGRLDDSGIAKPAPGAADVEDLVDGFTDAGLAVALSISGDLQTIAPSVGLTVYRIVQESIANVVKHAPGAGAEVTISVDARTVCISVRNRMNGQVTPTRDGGLGLEGMAERARLVGGTLRAGPGGGPTGHLWCVDAELPTGAL